MQKFQLGHSCVLCHTNRDVPDTLLSHPHPNFTSWSHFGVKITHNPRAGPRCQEWFHCLELPRKWDPHRGIGWSGESLWEADFCLFSYCSWGKEGKWVFLCTHQGKAIHFIAHLYCSYTRNAPSHWSVHLTVTSHTINKEIFEPPGSSSRNVPEENCCCTSPALPTSYTSNFPEVKQVYKCFPASDRASWISLQLGFVCSWFLPVASLSPPWRGCGDLIVVWLSWHSKRGMREGNYSTSPVLGRKQMGSSMTFLLFQESVGHTVHFQWGGSVIPNPLLLSLWGTKLRENHKTKMLPCSLNSCRLEGNKGRATFFTVKMPNPSDNSLMWKSHSSTKTVQFCGLRGAGELQKRWEILQVVSYSL